MAHYQSFNLKLSNSQPDELKSARKNETGVTLRLSSLSNTQLSKIIQPGRFLGRLLGPLLETGLPLMKNALKPMAKDVMIPLALTEKAPAADKFEKWRAIRASVGGVDGVLAWVCACVGSVDGVLA